MKRKQVFFILVLITIALGVVTFASAEVQKTQSQVVKIQKPPQALSLPRCSIIETSYNPSGGLERKTFCSFVLKYKCEGSGTIGPIEVEVYDGNGRLHAAKRDIVFQSGTHELSINIWAFEGYVDSDKIIAVMKYKGKEFFKRIDDIMSTRWFIGNPQVPLNQVITD